VSEVSTWFEGRRPRPPSHLEHALGSSDALGGLSETLLAMSRVQLDETRRRPGRVRESAFALLMADGLLTYACEAALESEDAEAALERLLSIGDER
jgi:hypothetical protein